MSVKKYVEIEWQEIRLAPFHDCGETKFYLNIATDYPTIYVAKNVNEKMISDVDQKCIEGGRWILRPRHSFDRILFSGYVENLLQVAITVLESDENSFINYFSDGSARIAEILKAGGALPVKVFPFLGVGSLLFAGLSSLLRDRNDLIGSCIYQLRRDCTFPMGQPLVCSLQKGGAVVGEVDLGIYIKPEYSESLSLFYRDVEVFPFSGNEIAVYYSGDLVESRQVYMLWTLDNWKSNPLVKMKHVGAYWVAILEIPSTMEVGKQLELAFTDGDKNWDSKDGNNWVFQNFRWS